MTLMGDGNIGWKWKLRRICFQLITPQPRRESKCQGSDVEDTKRQEWKEPYGRRRVLRSPSAAVAAGTCSPATKCCVELSPFAYSFSLRRHLKESRISEPRWITAQNRLVSAHPFKIRSLRLKPQSGRVLITLSLSFQSQKVRRLLFRTRTPFSGFRLEPPSPSQQILINLG